MPWLYPVKYLCIIYSVIMFTIYRSDFRLSRLQEIRMTRSCSRGAGRCPAVSRDGTLYGFGARPGVCTEAAVHGPCREDPKEATRLPARNTPARIAHLTAQPVSLIGEGIAWWRVTVWWKRCWFKNAFNCTTMTVPSKVEFGKGALHLPNACVYIILYAYAYAYAWDRERLLELFVCFTRTAFFLFIVIKLFID